MSKSKSKNYRVEDKLYEDGYYSNQHKRTKNKHTEKRLKRALKTKNIIDIEDQEEINF